MFHGKLINPRIVISNGRKYRFDNTLVIYLFDQEVERVEVNLPYEMPDSEIEILILAMVESYAKGIEPNPVVDSLVQWDWPQWDMTFQG